MSETPSFSAAAVVAPHAGASAAARDVLIEGGNAIEAAVAALAALSAVLPHAGAAGGDGLWLVREAGPRGRTRALDARGPVGDAVTLKHFRDRHLDAIPSRGPDGILTVPGAVAGWRAALDLAQALGGQMPVRRLLEPALGLARGGFLAPSPALRPMPPEIADEPGLAAAFLEDGKLPAAGSRRDAGAWGHTLAYLAEAGFEDFYRGDVGREIAQDLESIGSLVDRGDFRRFEARWRDPWSFRCGLGLFDTPPTRAGLTVLLGLGLFDRLKPAFPDSAAHLHSRIEAVKRAEAMIADAETPDPADLLVPARLEQESLTIDARRAAPNQGRTGPPEDGLWVGVIDGSGLAVSVVQSIGTTFGSGCLLPRTALLMGNRGARFELDNENGLVLRRGRRAPMDGLPAIVAGPRGDMTVLGASTASIALGIAAQVIAGMGFADAVAAPRAWSGGPGETGAPTLLMEEGCDPSTITALERLGHEVHPIAPLHAGDAGVVLRRVGGRVEAVAEPRREGSVDGL